MPSRASSVASSSSYLSSCTPTTEFFQCGDDVDDSANSFGGSVDENSQQRRKKRKGLSGGVVPSALHPTRVLKQCSSSNALIRCELVREVEGYYVHLPFPAEMIRASNFTCTGEGYSTIILRFTVHLDPVGHQVGGKQWFSVVGEPLARQVRKQVLLVFMM